MSPLPELLLTYYGDDFTGSTDVMEALSRAGVPTRLFVGETGKEERTKGREEGDLHSSSLPLLHSAGEARAYGLAGSSRSMPPERMEDELRSALAHLAALGAPITHYKVCSTFDSSPQVGSIGRAIEVGQEGVGSSWVPLVVGAPVLGRYCVFGNLFARSGLDSAVFRLDRHPTMRHHPTTPMTESDLRRVLAEQTGKRVGLVDAVQLEQDADGTLDGLLRAGHEVVLFDTLTEAHLAVIGRLVWERALREPLFAVGSSGLEYALVAYWRSRGWLPEPPVLRSAPVEQIVVVSGSCSPVTARQIEWAVEHGFVEIPLSPEELAGPGADLERVVTEAVGQIRTGRSVVLHTSRGPDDRRVAAARALIREHGGDPGASAEVLGTRLGGLLRRILLETGLRRAATTGGDTSGFIARALGIRSLEVAAPCAPGSPLCRVREDGLLDGCEVVFKGGQVGTDDFFGRVLRGHGGDA